MTSLTLYLALPGRTKVAFTMSESWQQSPRRSHIHNVGGRVMRAFAPSSDETTSPETPDVPEPAHTLVKTFTGYESDLTPLFFLPMIRYFTRVIVPEGTHLWNHGDTPDGIYVVESGVLRAIYNWDNSDVITESMVSGTLAGELTGLANMPRNASVVAEKPSVVWKLDKVHWSRFKEEQPSLAHRFVELVLKGVFVDLRIVFSPLMYLSCEKRLRCPDFRLFSTIVLQLFISLCLFPGCIRVAWACIVQKFMTMLQRYRASRDIVRQFHLHHHRSIHL